MKIKVKKVFRYQVTPTTVGKIVPGVYDVPSDLSKALADKVFKFGSAEFVIEKVAPENKLAKVAENKSGVGRKTKRGRRSGSKSND